MSTKMEVVKPIMLLFAVASKALLGKAEHAEISNSAFIISPIRRKRYISHHGKVNQGKIHHLAITNDLEGKGESVLESRDGIDQDQMLRFSGVGR